MKKSKRFCNVCHERVATIPDREIFGKPIPRVCSECHANRLKNDFIGILEVERKRVKK